MNYAEIRRLQLPEIFDPFGRAGVEQTQELVVWLRKAARAQSEGVPSRDVALRDALERMLERDMPRWKKEAERVRLFANVPIGIHLEPYIGWPRGSRTVEFGIRGTNHAAKTYLVALKLKKNGLLDRLRRCAQCRQWFFVYHPSRDRFCSDACRERAHRDSRKTPQARAQRATYMRRHREI